MRQNREAQRREAGMRCKQRGQALVEFALVISFLLVPTVVGLGALTGYIRSYIALTDAVSIAAQTLFGQPGADPGPVRAGGFHGRSGSAVPGYRELRLHDNDQRDSLRESNVVPRHQQLVATRVIPSAGRTGNCQGSVWACSIYSHFLWG